MTATTASAFEDSGFFAPTANWVSVDFAQASMPATGHAVGVRVRLVNTLQSGG